MKKLLLFGLALTAGIGASSAQSTGRHAGPVVRVDRTMSRHSADPSGNTGVTATGPSTARRAAYGTVIGQTIYDLQSNANTGNRLVRWPDGSLSVTWIEECQAGTSGSWPNRGAGYNFYNATTSSWKYGATGTCPDQFGVMSSRVGWPELLGFSSGKEMIVAHTPVKASFCPDKGTCDPSQWSTTTPLSIPATGEGIQWPRAAASGSYAHVIASASGTVNGVDGGISYYRSADQGVTWSEVMLPGHDSVSFPNGVFGEAYALDVNGSTVAITMGAYDSDWVLWKSTDNGATFTKTIIRDFHNTVTATDTTYSTNDSYLDVVVDNNGRVHAFAGQYQIGLDSMAFATFQPFANEGLLYWNDGPLANGGPRVLVSQIEDIYPTGDPNDFVGDGSYISPSKNVPYAYASLNSMPRAAVGADNSIYVVYSGVVEGTSNNGDPTGQSFRDLYVVKIEPSGNEWDRPRNIANDIANVGRTDFDEEVYPVVARRMGTDNKLHMTWMNDGEPGINVSRDADPETLNEIVYYSFDATVLSTKDNVASFVNSISAVPNPTNGVTTLSLNLKKATNATVRVTNVLGQQVLNINKTALQAGSNAIKVDMSNQATGIYLYTIVADDFTATQRIVKE